MPIEISLCKRDANGNKTNKKVTHSTESCDLAWMVEAGKREARKAVRKPKQK